MSTIVEGFMGLRRSLSVAIVDEIPVDPFSPVDLAAIYMPGGGGSWLSGIEVNDNGPATAPAGAVARTETPGPRRGLDGSASCWPWRRRS